jgi:hypothetical protein
MERAIAQSTTGGAGDHRARRCRHAGSCDLCPSDRHTTDEHLAAQIEAYDDEHAEAALAAEVAAYIEAERERGTVAAGGMTDAEHRAWLAAGGRYRPVSAPRRPKVVAPRRAARRAPRTRRANRATRAATSASAPPEPPAPPSITVTFWPSRRATCGQRVGPGPWAQFVRELLAAPEVGTSKESLPGWSAATFDGDRRSGTRVGLVYALVLDQDDGASLADVASVWRGTLAAIHSTWSHTARAPRWRIVVALSRPVTPAEHACVWTSAQARCAAAGLVIDASARDASRLWYVPARRPRARYVLRRLRGVPLDVEAVLAAARACAVSSPPNRQAKPHKRAPRHDESASGEDAKLAIRLVQGGASDREIERALARSARRKNNPSDYIDRTIAWARTFHERGLVRATVTGARLQTLPGWGSKPMLVRWLLDLATDDGEVLHAQVALPTAGYEHVRDTFAAVFPHQRWTDRLASIEGWRARGLLPIRGRVLDVAVHGGRVRWLRAAEGPS